MAIDPPPPNPERDRLEALVAFSRKRVERAIEKMDRERDNHTRARIQLEDDERALADWLEANPPDQPDLF